jgi:hypothetical protein
MAPPPFMKVAIFTLIMIQSSVYLAEMSSSTTAWLLGIAEPAKGNTEVNTR